MNKKVLIIAYFFPPIGGGGVIRTLKFTKFLPVFGYQPFVLTVKEGFYPIKDGSLLKELTKDIDVTRVKYFEPATWFRKGFWQSILSYIIYPFFLIPDRQILWFLPALKRASEIIEKENIKVIFTSSAPASDHLIGYFLKKYHSVKWVADFRDEWTNNPLRKFPTPIHRFLNNYWERGVIKRADRVISVSKPISKYLQTLEPKVNKFFTITNGFDRQDFEGIRPQKNKKQFTLMFSGSVYNSKIIEPFLRAIKELDLKDLKVEFIGIKKRVSHKEAVKRLLKADVLLLILDAVDRPAVLTGKLFEYLAARKPILALVPQNSGVAHLVKYLRVGEIASPQNIDEIKEKIFKLYGLWKHNRLLVPQINLEKYDRQNLTGELAKIFDDLIPERKIKLCLIGNLSSSQNQDLVEYLKDKNYEIHFISTTKAIVSGVKTYYLGPTTSTLWYFWRSKMKINHLVKNIQPDIVHGQDLVFGGIWAYLTGFHPLVATTWGSDIMNYEKFIRPEQYLIRKTLKNADLVTVSSAALENQAQKIGMPRQKAQLVHFGIDLNIFKKQNLKKIKSKLKINPAEKIIFCPRSIAPVYNTDILIEALAELNHSGKYKLILLEQNANEDCLIKIEKLIIKYNLVDDVVFLPRLQPEEMAEYYNSADAVATISSSDGCARSFLEAMAVECKIVASDLPYIKEWQTKGNLWLVPVRDVQATVKAIVAAIKFPKAKWQKIGEANRRQIAEKAEIKINFDKLDRLYRELI